MTRDEHRAYKGPERVMAAGRPTFSDNLKAQFVIRIQKKEVS